MMMYFPDTGDLIECFEYPVGMEDVFERVVCSDAVMLASCSKN